LQDIIDTVFGGAGSQTGYIAWPFQGLPWPKAGSEMGPYYSKYDPQAAKQMLDAAGVGEITVPIQFLGQITPGTGLAVGDPYVESARQNLKELGITLELTANDYLGNTRNFYAQDWNGLFSFGVGGATALDADAYLRQLQTGAGLNGSGHSDAQVDQWIEDFRAEYDPEAGFEIARKIDEYVVEDQATFGISMPQGFGLILWQKYMNNLIDAPAWWITGGAGQEFGKMWLTDQVPDRDTDSF